MRVTFKKQTNKHEMLFTPFSCATRLAFRAFLPLAMSLSVTVVQRFILPTAEERSVETSACVCVHVCVCIPEG